MTRKGQIERAALNQDSSPNLYQLVSFELGAEWADANPTLAFLDAMMVIHDLQTQLKIAMEALRYIANSCPGPEQEFELENKFRALDAVNKITKPKE